MKKVILVYGAIAGTIVSAMMFITMLIWNDGKVEIKNGELLGYSTMIIAFTMIFFGIKSFRDNYSNGTISFLKATQVGVLIALVASLMYGVSWEMIYPRVGQELMAKMGEKRFDELKKKETSEVEIQKAKDEWAGFLEMYKNPFVRFGMTLVEIFPVGLVITLICAALLRKKEFLPARSNASVG
jgi:fumarate reductase subunit C